MLEQRLAHYFERGWIAGNESENSVTVNTGSSAFWFQNDEFYYDIVLGLASEKVKIVITESSTQSAVYHRFNELKPGIIWKVSNLLGIAVDLQLYMQVTKPAELPIPLRMLKDLPDGLEPMAAEEYQPTKKEKNDRTK
jgi:hypothetical protein